MFNFIQAVRQSILTKNWYAALLITLTLPDICSKLEFPSIITSKRYIDWFNKYMLKKYSSKVEHNFRLHVFLSGNDCYALRCSFLHEGNDIIQDQCAHQSLESFYFLAPNDRLRAHRNQSNNKLQLQVDIFCEDMCLAVEEWIKEISSVKPEVLKEFDNLLKVHTIEDGPIAF